MTDSTDAPQNEGATPDATQTNTDANDILKRLEAAEAEVSKWKEYSRKNEAAKKAALSERDALAPKATEAEALATRLQELEGRYKQAEVQVLRTNVANAKKIPAEAIDFLKGETEEELLASADKLATLIAAQQRSQLNLNSFQGQASAASDVKLSPLEQALQNELQKALG